MSKARPLMAQLQKVAIEELNEVPERIPEDIEALRSWIAKQSYLKARTDEQFLLAFLRGSKFSLEKAKSKIDRYYTLRTRYPDFFTVQNVDCPKVLELLRIGVGVHLPTPLHENGPRIVLVRAGIFPTEKFNFSDVMAVMYGLQSITILMDDYAIVNGVVAVIDMATVTAGHMFQMTPGIMKKTATFADEALPLRDKGQHFINTPAGWEAIFNTLKPLMTDKQKERIYVHGDKLERLYEYVPQKYLPREYGGENGSIAEILAGTEAVFNEWKDYLREDITYGTDESLRPSATNGDETIYGKEGSFRQLNLD